MTVNSLTFLWFFLIVLAIYYLCQKRTEIQNVFLLISSYWFYSQVDIKMTGLLIVLTIVFWILGKGVHLSLKKENERKAAIITNIGVFIGIGALFYFKYLNFFAESFVAFANLIGIHLSWTTLNLVVPIGLSFFTFKLISYVLDIYHGKIEPERNIVCFSNYIAFFPTILSGPIDRPKPFLKQVNQIRIFNSDNLMTGFRRILWGMFLKMCIADRLDIYVNAIWNNYEHHSAISIIFATLLYPIQLYADFGGYSEMAIGVALMLGFKVAENFKRPFFTVNISEYWKRWHMSLTSWLTDYVFMPLNIKLRRWGTHGTIAAIILNMTFIGLWHGADWTFLFFGIYHGLWFIPLMISGQFFKKTKSNVKSNGLPTMSFIMKMIGNYLVVAFGLMLFHANNITEFRALIYHLPKAWNGPLFLNMPTLVNAGLCIIALIYVDIQEEWFPNKHINLPKWVNTCRWELIVVTELGIVTFVRRWQR